LNRTASLGNLALNFDRTKQSACCARKDHQETVAGCPDDASTMYLDRRFNDLRSELAQARMRAMLVLSNETRVSRDISNKNCG
jgi:hypothetical protein